MKIVIESIFKKFFNILILFIDKDFRMFDYSLLLILLEYEKFCIKMNWYWLRSLKYDVFKFYKVVK